VKPTAIALCKTGCVTHLYGWFNNANLFQKNTQPVWKFLKVD